jgi:2-dehydro-3-deoxy-D-arabinonate dehydratase
MRIYRIESGVLIESEGEFYRVQERDWDEFINDDELFQKATEIVNSQPAIGERGATLIQNELLPSVKSQEVWASGVTYFNSKLARQEESKDAGGGDFYARVYVADRPELFFKSAGHRVRGSGEKLRIRRDSSWNVPEPELTLFITSSGKIVAYTIGNDMSSRSIEGENPLYLPQAKTYDGSAAIGPCLYVSDTPLPKETEIEMVVDREGKCVFDGKIQIGQMKRTPDELASWLYRETSFPFGCFLMTGTGIVPPKEFTLESGDKVSITIEPIGALMNPIE